MLSAGNNTARYFTEFADEDVELKGVAISRMAQVMMIAFERLEGDGIGQGHFEGGYEGGHGI